MRDGKWHVSDPTVGQPGNASPILHGSAIHPGRAHARVTQGGTAASREWSRALYADGGSPTRRLNVELNEPSEVNPTAMHTSVTDSEPPRSSAIARSTRRACRYAYGVSP